MPLQIARKPRTESAKISHYRRFQMARRSRVPDAGWAQCYFEGRKGLSLQMDMIMIYRLERARGIERLSRDLKEILDAQYGAVVDRAREATLGAYGQLSWKGFNVPQRDILSIWLEAIRTETVRFTDAIKRRIRNAATSIAFGVFTKTAELLGYRAQATSQTALVRKIGEMAEDSESLTGTSQRRLNDRVDREIQRIGEADGDVPAIAVADRLQNEIGKMVDGRVPTISRTEAGRAADIGRIEALQQSGVVTHVSVVGCCCIEATSPTYRGIPTCNIQNVPIEDASQLTFHPNHQGMIIPSRLVDSPGRAPATTMGEGVIDPRLGGDDPNQLPLL